MLFPNVKSQVRVHKEPTQLVSGKRFDYVRARNAIQPVDDPARWSCCKARIAICSEELGQLIDIDNALRRIPIPDGSDVRVGVADKRGHGDDK